MRSKSWFKGLLSTGLPLLGLLAAVVLGPVPTQAAAPAGARLAPPKALGTLPADWVSGGEGVVLFGAGGSVHVAPFDHPGAPIASLELQAPVEGAAVVGRYAYLAQAGLGLRVLDLGVPDQPADLGLIPFEGSAFQVTQWADYLLVASDASFTVLSLGTRHSHVMDGAGGHCMAMVDPFALGEVASMRLDGIPVALSASGPTAFLATQDRRLLTIDLSDRANPKVTAVQDLPAEVTALAAHLEGVALGLAGSKIASLPERSSLGGPVISGARGLASTGRVLLVASGGRGLFAARDESAPEATVNVNVGNFFFSPANVTINQGDTVHWVWVSGTHTTTSGACAGVDCTPDGHWASPGQSSGSFNHTFADAGTFPYFCQVHGSSMTGKVTVNSTGPTPLSATATATPDSGDVPLTVSFTGTAAGGTPPYTYSWSFGDGSTSTDQNPSHTYAAIGTYTAVLTVHDAAAALAQSEGKTITVHTHTTNPPVITLIKKVSPPFGIVVTGSNLQSGIEVFINGSHWDSVVWKNTGKIKLGGGKSLKTAVPKGATTAFRFENPDGGSATVNFSW